MHPLSDEQVAAYRRDGFMVVKGAYSPAEVAELSQVTNTFVEKSRALSDHNEIFDVDLAAGHSAQSPKLRRIKHPHKWHPVYRAALEKSAVLDIVGQLIGNHIRMRHSKLNAKAPGGGAAVEWHTDWGYYPHTNDDILEVGIAIDDVTLENGCLMILPGSHRQPAHDHHENGLFVGAVAPDSFNMNDAVPVLLAAGDISIHHVRLLHGSAPNTSSRTRRVLFHGYAAADAWPLMGIHQPESWEEWNSWLLRGEPTVAARMGAGSARIPLPAPSAVGLFEIQEHAARSHYAAAGGGASM